MKFTQRAIDAEALPPGKADKILFDDALAGFGLRLREGGTRMFIVQYKLGSKHRRMTLGSTAALKLEAARIRAGEILAAVRAGRDPAGEKTEAKARAGDIFEPMARRYLAHQRAHLRPRSYTAAEMYLLSHFKPLHGLAVARIDRRTVAARLSEIATSNGPAAADRARATLSAFFVWMGREGIVEANPVAMTNRHAVAGGRERVLSGDELAEVWRAAGDGIYGTVIRLLILTGQRREEIAGLQWSEIKFAAKTIELPAERVKNGRPHDVPLSDRAMQMLRAVPQRLDGGLVFGIKGFSVPKRALDSRIAVARREAGIEPMKPWVIHDLRRSLATGMGDQLKVAPHVVEAMLNHVSGHKKGVAGVYNKAIYWEERRAALCAWADYVLAAAGETSKATA
jgi:integrase